MEDEIRLEERVRAIEKEGKEKTKDVGIQKGKID